MIIKIYFEKANKEEDKNMVEFIDITRMVYENGQLTLIHKFDGRIFEQSIVNISVVVED